MCATRPANLPLLPAASNAGTRSLSVMPFRPCTAVPGRTAVLITTTVMGTAGRPALLDHQQV